MLHVIKINNNLMICERVMFSHNLLYKIASCVWMIFKSKRTWSRFNLLEEMVVLIRRGGLSCQSQSLYCSAGVVVIVH